MKQPVFFLIIPAYNEGSAVLETVSAAKHFGPVVVIDDGSTDTSGEYARQGGATVLTQQENQGKGAALKRGFTHALEKNAEFVIMLDADGQHDPGDIPTFLRDYEKNRADLIIGWRRFSHMPWTRRIANWVGRKVFSWAVGQRIRDNQSGYRLLSRRLMQDMVRNEEIGFEFEVDMITTAIKNKYPISWVPIQTIYGEEKSHIRPLPHIYKFFSTALKARKQLRSKS